MNFRIFSIALIAGLMATFAATKAQAATWQTEPVDLSGEVGFSLFLDKDPAGVMQAAFYTSNPNGDLRYARRGSTGWQVQADITYGKAFAVDNTGNRFFVSTPTGPNYYPQYQILLDNGPLLSQQITNKRISENVFLDFDSQNRPQIGYVDTAAQQLKLASWNGTSWTINTVASGTEFSYGSWSFVAAIDSSDHVHFAWQNTSNVLRYADPVGSSAWQITSPFPTLSARPLDIKMDSTGSVHLAYDVFTGNTFTGGLFYSVDQNGTWTGGRIPGLDSFGEEKSKVVLDAQGAPHIFTYDSTFSGPDVLKHLFKINGNWTSETISSISSTVSGPQEIAALYDTDGFHVLYATGTEQVYYSSKSNYLPGDFNRDGLITGADVKAMLSAMANLSAYETANNLTDAQLKSIGDLNGSGTITNADLQYLLTMLKNGGASGDIVPEPPALSLMLGGTLGLALVLCSSRHRRAKFAD